MVLLSSTNTGTTAIYFHNDGKVTLLKLRLKYKLTAEWKYENNP